MADECFNAEYYLTQIVSHLNVAPVERFVNETVRRGIGKPGMFGVFYYRSANAKTLAALGQFLPVPVEGLSREFGAGATAIDVCARTLRAMLDVGARHFYISNLPLDTAASTLGEILDRIGVSWQQAAGGRQ
jgi:hypothetical protein